MKKIMVVFFTCFIFSAYAHAYEAARFYIYWVTTGTPLIDAVDAYNIPVDLSMQYSQSGNDGLPVINVVVGSAYGASTDLDILDSVLPETVYKIPRYAGDKLISTIPSGTKSKIIDKMNEWGIPLNWFDGCETWRDFLTRVLKFVHLNAYISDNIGDDELGK